MANRNEGIHVTGIPELARALKAVDADLYKQLRIGMRDIARHVIGVAEGRGAPVGILRPRATQRGAGIAFPAGGKGSASDPEGFYPWLDFGGGRRGGQGVTPSGDRRAVKPEGRYVYPAIGASREYIGEEVGEIIGKVATGHGFEVRR